MYKTIILFFCLTLSPFLFSQTAEEILDQAAKAQLNGSAVDELYSLQHKMTLTMPGGVEAKMVSTFKEGAKCQMKITIPSLNMTIEQGCDGKDCYMSEPMLGPRLLEGEELGAMLIQADFKSDFNWREAYTSFSFEGEEEVNGRPCYKVKLVTAGGVDLVNFYDKETYLLRRTDAIMVDKVMGKISSKTLFDSYQVFDGLKMPTHIIQEALSNRIEQHIETYKFNVPVDDSVFTIPASLKKAETQDAATKKP